MTSKSDDPRLQTTDADDPAEKGREVSHLGDEGRSQPGLAGSGGEPSESTQGSSGGKEKIVEKLNEAVSDQVFRRYFRAAIVLITLLTVVTLVCNLHYVIRKTTKVYTHAIEQHAGASIRYNELVAKRALVAGQPASSAQSATKATESAVKEKPSHEGLPIFGEMRDALVPIVVIISVLAASIVVILVTSLKASFATPDAGDSSLPKHPFLEALKNLLDALVSVIKK